MDLLKKMDDSHRKFVRDKRRRAQEQPFLPAALRGTTGPSSPPRPHVTRRGEPMPDTGA